MVNYVIACYSLLLLIDLHVLEARLDTAQTMERQRCECLVWLAHCKNLLLESVGLILCAVWEIEEM